ncbi:MAG: Nramp family divalent metal transporter [Flavobacteriaceae bacterium]|nr:Nramp family divalent metal transporter [Flavobacteriaceae bacterium]
MKHTIFAKLGPGLLFAGAAIGVSHLVQSTRAGADYGWGLLWALLLVNLFKYPFFQYGPRYALATNENLLQGYFKLGKPLLWLYFVLNIATMFTVQTAVTIVTAGIASELFGFTTNLGIWSAFITGVCLLILIIGRYTILDRVIKIIILVLTICSVVSFSIALGNDASPTKLTQIFPANEGLLFLAAFMGWMPAPMDISIWHSLWTLEKKRSVKDKLNLSEGLFDFKVGYWTTVFLGICFMGLGATVMFESGLEFSNSGTVFAGQLIALYTSNLGVAFYGIIGLAALTTMFSTTLTTLDASPRVMSQIGKLLWNQKKDRYLFWILVLSIGTLSIFFFFLSEMGTLVQIATILSFITAPLFAILNYFLVTSSHMPKEAQPNTVMRWLSRIGIVFLTAFALFYLLSLL